MDFDKYEELFGLKKNPRKAKTTQIVDKLMHPPKKDVGNNMPRFVHISVGLNQQADLLSLPHDEGYKYALVVEIDWSMLNP